MHGRIWSAASLSGLMLLGGCGRPSDSAVRHAIERAWQRDPITMQVDTGLLSAADARGLHGARSSTQAALGAVGAYAGSTVAQAAGDVVGVVSEFAKDVGGDAVAPAARQAALMSARGWRVTNLEVLDSRSSSSEYVFRVRYDVGAVIAGRDQVLGRDLTETVRLENGDDGWTVVPAES